MTRKEINQRIEIVCAEIQSHTDEMNKALEYLSDLTYELEQLMKMQKDDSK